MILVQCKSSEELPELTSIVPQKTLLDRRQGSSPYQAVANKDQNSEPWTNLSSTALASEEVMTLNDA